MSLDGLKYYIHTVAKRVSQEQFQDTVLKGEIVDAAILYRVKISRSNSTSEVFATVLAGPKNYKRGDMVYLLVAASALGNENAYFIVGRTQDIEGSYAAASEWERFESIANPISIEAGREYTNAELIENINETRHFAFWATVTTEGKSLSNSAGFKFTLKTVDGKQYSSLFTLEHFEGQPTRLKNSIQKTLISLIDLNITELLQSVKIEVKEIEAKDCTIEVGRPFDISKLLDVAIDADNGKDFFTSVATTSEEKVSITATAKYLDQVLDSNLVQYYWYLKNQNDEWELLNASKDVTKIGLDGTVKTTTGYYASSPTIVFATPTKLTKYENKIKCVVKYQFATKESPELSVYNFNKYDVDLTLKAVHNDSTVQDDKTIIFREDRITVSAEAKGNEKAGTRFEYLWSWPGISSETAAALKNKKSIVVADIADGTDVSTVDCNIADSATETFISISCQVEVRNQANELLDTSEVKDITITSLVSVNKVEQTEIYYYGSEVESVPFKEEFKENSLWGAIGWTDDLEELRNGTPSLPYYIFMTSRKVWKQVNDTSKVLQEGEWSFPEVIEIIYEDKTVTDKIWLAELNAFNKLTNNGQDQGIYYQEDPVYVVTEDERPKENKMYYYWDEDEYVGIGWDEIHNYDTDLFKDMDKVYYEKNTNTHLYLNANYIRTGTLQVGTGENERFFASIGNPDVRIGGFEVSETSLIKKDQTVGISSGEKSFWAGRPKKETKEVDIVIFSITLTDGADVDATYLKGSYSSAQVDLTLDTPRLYLDKDDNGNFKTYEHYFKYKETGFFNGSRFKQEKWISEGSDSGWAMKEIYIVPILEDSFWINKDGEVYISKGKFLGPIRAEYAPFQKAAQLTEDGILCLHGSLQYLQTANNIVFSNLLNSSNPYRVDEQFTIDVSISGNDESSKTLIGFSTPTAYGTPPSLPYLGLVGKTFVSYPYTKEYVLAPDRKYPLEDEGSDVFCKGLSSEESHHLPGIYSYHFDRATRAVSPDFKSTDACFNEKDVLLIGKTQTWYSNNTFNVGGKKAFRPVQFKGADNNYYNVGGHGFKEVYGAIANPLANNIRNMKDPEFPSFGGLPLSSRVITKKTLFSDEILLQDRDGNSSWETLREGPYIIICGDGQSGGWSWWGINVIIFGL